MEINQIKSNKNLTFPGLYIKLFVICSTDRNKEICEVIGRDGKLIYRIRRSQNLRNKHYSEEKREKTIFGMLRTSDMGNLHSTS